MPFPACLKSRIFLPGEYFCARKQGKSSGPDFDAIPLDVVDYAQIQSQAVPGYPAKQVSLQLDVYLNPLGKARCCQCTQA